MTVASEQLSRRTDYSPLLAMAVCTVPPALAVWLGNTDPVTGALAACGFMVCVYPTVRYIRGHSQEAPLLPVIGLIYACYFVLPALFGDATYFRFSGLPADSYTYALALAVAGICGMLVGSSAARRTFGGVRSRWALDPGWSDSRATRLSIAMGVAGIAVALVTATHPVSGNVATAVEFIGQLPTLSISVLFYLELKGRLELPARLVLWCGLIPCQFAIDISSSLLYAAFRDGFVLLAIYLLARHRFPWRAALLAVLLAFPFLAFKAQYRQDLTVGYYAGGNPLGNAVGYTALVVTQAPTLLDPQVAAASARDILNRLDNRALLAYVLDHTPADVPYWSGGSYVDGIWKFVPRVIAPDKPGEDMGQEFGHRYDILDYTDSNTSWNLPQIVELYANFGFLGVLFGMFAIGMLYALMQVLLEGAGRSEWTPIFAMFIYSNLFRVDSNFSLVFGGAFYSFVLLALLTRLVLRPWPSRDAHGERSSRPPLVAGTSRRAG